MNPRLKKMVSWIVAGAVIIGMGALFRFWYAAESARTHDAQILVAVRTAEMLLETYRQQYAAYPGSRDEFVQRIGTLVVYEPLSQDGTALCEEVRCPNYHISYMLETNVFESKGAHTVSPILLSAPSP